MFEHLRQIKLHKKQQFSESLENLTKTLESRSESAKQALQNDRLEISKKCMTGTRTIPINTEIEPSYENSKKLNVDEVTILEPNDKGIVPQETQPDNIYQRIVFVMKQSTQEYYNMRMMLGLEVT